MKITEKVISIPPYISTSWSNVKTLQIEGGETLVLILQDNSKVKIPNLSQEEIDQVFQMHAKVVEGEDSSEKKGGDLQAQFGDAFSKMSQLFSNEKEGIFQVPLNMEVELDSSMENLGVMMQHNEAQKDMDPLPSEVLAKVSAVGKLLGLEHEENLPDPEPNCNCFYCQIVRAMHRGVQNDEDHIDEEISDEDLRFKEWDIQKSGEKLYSVTNPLDSSEHYSVYLGDPIGCTCGQKDCEHIKAVLQS